MRVDTKASFSYFIYPFTFDSDTFADRVSAVNRAMGRNKKGEFVLWEVDRFVEDDLLAHVAGYLNPPDGAVPTACLWKLSDASSDIWGLRGRADWRLRINKTEIPFDIGDAKPGHFAVQLVLFQDGVGFVTVHARPTTTQVDSWLDFLHYFRFIRGQRKACLRGERRLGLDPASKTPQCGPFFPQPVGGLNEHPDGCGAFDEIIDALLTSACLTTDSYPWWEETFVPGQMLPFAALYVDDTDPAAIPGLLYRFRQFFSAHHEACPSAEDLRPDHPLLLPYADRQWFTFSLDGGGFLACDAPPNSAFFRQTLPDHLRTSYFLLFLMALRQRFFLIHLSGEVAGKWFVKGDRASLEQREQTFTRLREKLLSFTARGHFVQIMQREHHHRCYRRWLEVLQIEELYRGVRDEVQHIHDFLMMQRAERLQQLQEAEQRQAQQNAAQEEARELAAQKRADSLEQLLAAIAAIFGVPALGMTFLELIEVNSVLTKIVVTVSLFILGAGLYLLARWFLARRFTAPAGPEKTTGN
jgi:hypothetical protein